MQRQRQQPRSPRRRPATERRFRIGVTTFLLVAAVVAVGATVQGIVGFGLNLIAAPLVGIVEPRLVPSTMVVVAMPLYWSMARRERHAIDWPLIGWISVGRLPGIAVGAALVSRIPHDRLSVLVGAVVVAAAALSFAAPDVSTTPVTAMTAGLIAGAMDTTAAVGGPPLALLTQHRAAAEIRSTLAVAFPIGTVLSIAALAAAGKVEWWHLEMAVLLAPAVLGGAAIGAAIARRLGGASIRPAVLTLAALAGIAAIWRGW